MEGMRRGRAGSECVFEVRRLATRMEKPIDKRTTIQARNSRATQADTILLFHITGPLSAKIFELQNSDADCSIIGSRSPPPRVRHHLPPQEVRLSRLRWFQLRQLRQGPRRPRLPDRGAEDRQEGSQGVAGEGRRPQEALDVVLNKRERGLLVFDLLS